MEFKHALWGLCGLLGALFWVLDFLHLLKKPELFFPVRGEGITFSRKFLKSFLFLAGLASWLLITIALMRPIRRSGPFYDEKEISDLYIVIDTSRSMLANDYSPNRLEVAKGKIQEFIRLHPSERIGIIVFSEQVMTLLPMTVDLELVEQIIPEIQTGLLGNGTNIGDAVGLAVARLMEEKTRKKTILLLTDGVSQVDTITPLEAAELAREKGIKIHSVAIGSDREARIPVPDFLLGTRYQLIPGGSVDVETLKKMSSLSGGKFFMAKDEKALKEILAEIEKLERTKVKIHSRTLTEEMFFNYLMWGLLLLMGVEIFRKGIMKEVL